MSDKKIVQVGTPLSSVSVRTGEENRASTTDACYFEGPRMCLEGSSQFMNMGH